jgi:hypothetical protein
MKTLNKLSILALTSILVLSSCETTELDLTSNPNALNPSQASADLFINKVQVDFAYFVNAMSGVGSRLVRINQLSGDRLYADAYGPGSFSGVWQTAYQGMMEDIRVMNTIAAESGLTYYIGMGEVIQAYTLLTLVDFFGDIPWSEALQGSENLNPGLDSGQSVYNVALNLLDSAISNFSSGGASPQYDMYYGGNATNWIKAANSIKKKAYLNLGEYANYRSITNYITNSSADFQFQWGDNEVNPDTRHPMYRSSYSNTGAGVYQSNWLMNRLMIGRNGQRDPRINYLFYRQVALTPGKDGPTDEVSLECSVDGYYIEPHRVAYGVYCSLPEGYWGRDHGNDDGIPPDGFKRTIAGIYPAGGAFDDESYQSLGPGDGEKGVGITPIILNSWMHFMNAEVAVMTNDTPAITTQTLAGIRSSLNKVDDSSGAPEMSAASIDSYITNFASEWTAAGTLGGKLELWAEEFWIASQGGGIENYNSYRRNGYPQNLQPMQEPNPGTFPSSMWYPQNLAANNSNVSQKNDVAGKVFWNTNGPTVD